MQNLLSLTQFGLTANEQEVYFALLQLEKATANEVARKAGIKRPTTYDIIYRLQDIGFIYETIENKKRMYIPAAPKHLVRIIDERKRELLADLPFLTSLYNTKAKRPKVAYFEGSEGIRQLYEDTLLSCRKGDEILAYVTVETIESLLEYSIDYVKRRVEKGITLRGIYSNMPSLTEFLKKDIEQMRISKVVDPVEFPIHNEINIYADKVIIITYSPEPFGVLIESKEIADTQRSIFKMAWQGIE